MIISVVFVSMMVVFVTVYHFVTKPKKQQEKIYSAMNLSGSCSPCTVN